MPASSSVGRGRWRKRKREYPSAHKSRLKEPEIDDTFEENEDDDDPDLDPPQNPLETTDDPQDHGPDAGNRISQEKESEKLADTVVRICDFPTAVKRAVKKPHSSVLGIVEAERSARVGDIKSQNRALIPVLENISYGQLQTLSAIPRDSALTLSSEETSSGSGSGSYVIKPPSVTPGRGLIKRLGSAGRVHALPAHSADWFSLNTVHRLERQVVPHFFTGKSLEHTPEKYMECRNFIVAKYVEQPEKHLTVSDCQDIVSGIEIDDLNRIVRFLDHWGIINYCAGPLTHQSQNDGTYLFEDSNRELHMPWDALKSIDSLIKFDKPKCRLKAADVYSEISHQRGEDSDFDNSVREQLSDNHCIYCCRSLSTVYYQSNKEVNVLLCLECFDEGRFVSGHSSLDFVKFYSWNDSRSVDGVGWGDEETLRLLEGVQFYGDNWNKIADHVGTKSKPQCILHFARLPLDGAPIENIDLPTTSEIRHDDEHQQINPHSNGFRLPKSDSESVFPFKDLGNPVMSMVAFLASALGPRVAAACAQASLDSLCKNGDNDGNPHKETTSTNTKGPRSSQHESEEPSPLSAEKVMDAAKYGLAAAAVKGKLFADHEEREIQRLSANIVNQQMKRLELKLKQIAEIETSLMRECEQVERTRQRTSAERALMASSQYGSPTMSRPTNLQRLMPNNRPQVPSSQQPLTNYGNNNNQPIHPHISLMQQPGMYGLSPRLPLSAMQQPSSSSFNPQLNSQSSLGHPMLRPSISGTKSDLG